MISFPSHFLTCRLKRRDCISYLIIYCIQRPLELKRIGECLKTSRLSLRERPVLLVVHITSVAWTIKISVNRICRHFRTQSSIVG